ncbi:MAG: DEAD/DEAH box helicase, partial [Anaerolineales bacterium]
MAEYLAIAVNVPKVSGVFHYHAPEKLEGRLKPGHLVLVPFGPRRVQGVVLERVLEPEVPETKPIELLLDELPVLTELQLQFARNLAASTLAPLAACVNLMLPPGIGKLSDVEYAISEEARRVESELPTAQKRLLKLLSERGPLRSRQISRALPRKNWRASIAALVHKGLVEAGPLAPVPSVRPKITRTVERTNADGDMKLGRGAAQARREKILELLENETGPVDASWLLEESSGNSADLKTLARLGFVRLSERELFRDPLDELTYDASQPPKLTEDQERVWEHVHKALALSQQGQETKPILLHGVTGSGKTEIYLQAVAKTLTMGRQAIVLVPEIALTPQTARRFLERFANQVGLIHSELSEGERYDTWRRARAGQLPVIIGPRSALFA